MHSAESQTDTRSQNHQDFCLWTTLQPHVSRLLSPVWFYTWVFWRSLAEFLILPNICVQRTEGGTVHSSFNMQIQGLYLGRLSTTKRCTSLRSSFWLVQELLDVLGKVSWYLWDVFEEWSDAIQVQPWIVVRFHCCRRQSCRPDLLSRKVCS